MTSPTTSPTLLKRLRSNSDQAAWRQFVALYGPLVYRLAQQHGMDPGAADAVVQDFCIRALQALPNFTYQPQRGRFRNWVLTVALNEIRRLRRAEAARKRVVGQYRREAANGAGGAVPSWWQQDEFKQMLQLALEELRGEAEPEKFAVFYLAAVEGTPIGEVASFYGLTKPQVSLIKFRLLGRLRAIAQRIAEDLDER